MHGDGLQMKSLPVPFPSAVAGFFRTRSATDEAGRFIHAGDAAACQKLLDISVRGPWLVELGPSAERPLLPAPGDALQLVGATDALRIARLGRLAPLGDREATDLTTEEGQLALVGPAGRIADKPARRRVTFWYWDQLEQWLTDPNGFPSQVQPNAVGWPDPALEPRTNVAINGDTRTGEAGKLFTIEHRRFQGSVGGGPLSSHTRRLALLASCDAPGIRPGVVPFAGERRLIALRKSQAAHPAMPDAVRKCVIADRSARIVLVTPAVFTLGWRPTWLLKEREGVRVTLQAAITPRPEVVSGWDMAQKRPKPTRRLVPAGGVYFVRLDGDEASINRWLDATWWQCVSDDEQARRDGFGLCVIGTDPELNGDAR
jgi:CRISPR-associated protein Cmr3